MDMFYELAAGTVENRDEERVRKKQELYSECVEGASALPDQASKR